MFCKNKGRKYVVNILATICFVLWDIEKCVSGYTTGSTDNSLLLSIYKLLFNLYCVSLLYVMHILFAGYKCRSLQQVLGVVEECEHDNTHVNV